MGQGLGLGCVVVRIEVRKVDGGRARRVCIGPAQGAALLVRVRARVRVGLMVMVRVRVRVGLMVRVGARVWVRRRRAPG